MIDINVAKYSKSIIITYFPAVIQNGPVVLKCFLQIPSITSQA